jgi:hypothetical protein
MLETDLLLARIDIVDGRYETGLRDGMRAAREARDAGFEAVGVTGYRNLAIMAARIMDPHAAELALREGLQYADAIEQSHCRQMMATDDRAPRLGRRAVGQRRRASPPRDRRSRLSSRGSSGSLDVIGLIAMGRGHTDEARRWFDESLASGRQMEEVPFILTPLWGLAETDLLVDDADTAIARCEQGWSIAHANGDACAQYPISSSRGHERSSPRGGPMTQSDGSIACGRTSRDGSPFAGASAEPRRRAGPTCRRDAGGRPRVPGARRPGLGGSVGGSGRPHGHVLDLGVLPDADEPLRRRRERPRGSPRDGELPW